MTENKCRDCLHNLNPDCLDCEYQCGGVSKITDEGRIVLSCDDYEPQEDTE